MMVSPCNILFIIAKIITHTHAAGSQRDIKKDNIFSNITYLLLKRKRRMQRISPFFPKNIIGKVKRAQIGFMEHNIKKFHADRSIVSEEI